MGNISPTYISDGTQIDAEDVNSLVRTVVNEFNGSIDSNNLAANSVNTSELASDAVTTAKIADEAVTTDKIDFTTFGTSFDTAYTAQAAVSSVSLARIRITADILFVTLTFVLGSSVDDNTTDLVQINYATLGITSTQTVAVCGFSDIGNAIMQIVVSTAGMVQSVGNEPAGLVSGDTIQVSFSTPITAY